MNQQRRLSLFLSTLLASACATATSRPLALDADHPASPSAGELPLADPSAALFTEAPPPLGEPPAPATPAATGAFVCPMHDDVASDEPGTCPKCGMKLVPREDSAHEEHPQ